MNTMPNRSHNCPFTQAEAASPHEDTGAPFEYPKKALQAFSLALSHAKPRHFTPKQCCRAVFPQHLTPKLPQSAPEMKQLRRNLSRFHGMAEEFRRGLTLCDVAARQFQREALSFLRTAAVFPRAEERFPVIPARFTPVPSLLRRHQEWSPRKAARRCIAFLYETRLLGFWRPLG